MLNRNGVKMSEEIFKIEKELVTIGKTLNDRGEFTDVYKCPFCEHVRSTNYDYMMKHMKQCYHEEEFRAGVL